MVHIKLKRVYEPEEEQDGFRILVDKLWPRGIKKENLPYDVWAKDIAPSTPLRTWYHTDKDKNWELFSQRYIKELAESTAVAEIAKTIKDKETVTLLFGSKNAIENHAIILKDYLEKYIQSESVKK